MAASTPQALSVRAAAETLLEAINISSSRCQRLREAKTTIVALLGYK